MFKLDVVCIITGYFATERYKDMCLRASKNEDKE